MAQHQQIRVVAPGYATLGRDLLRGVVAYMQDHNLPWRLHAELAQTTRQGPDWKADEATIFAVADQRLVEKLASQPHPLINCLAHYEAMGLPTVRTDDAQAGRLAADHFLERGFERFFFFAAGDRSAAAQLRARGFRERLAEADQRMVWLCEPGEPDRSDPHTDVWARVPQILREQTFPVALFCSTDPLARIVASYLSAAEINVPHQVALLGVDDDELQCQIATPPLSSVAMPYEELGWEAARLAEHLLEGKPAPSQPQLLQPLGVTARASTDVVAVADPTLAEAVRYIREHAGDPCGVDDVVAHLDVSRRWLQQQFREQFGRTPHEQIMHVRMQHACSLLRASQLSIPLIAERCGYVLPQNFCRAFKQTMGQTPGAYRAAHAPQLARIKAI